jgi:hypothetical protein
MHVLRNAKGTMLTIAKDVHKYAAAAPKNAEGWLDEGVSSSSLFF